MQPSTNSRLIETLRPEKSSRTGTIKVSRSSQLLRPSALLLSPSPSKYRSGIGNSEKKRARTHLATNDELTFTKLPYSSPIQVPRLNTRKQSSQCETLTPEIVLKKYEDQLSNLEKREISRAREIHYLGLQCAKILPNPKLENHGYDNNGIYQVIRHDQIAYRYELLDPIGEGTFAQVYSAYDHKEKKSVAMKIVKNLPRFSEYSLKEVEILRGLKRTYNESSGVIDLLDSFEFRKHRFLVFGLLHKTLHQYLKQYRPIPTERAVELAYNILTCLAQFHRKGIIHADLKPDNIMFTSREQDTLKIIDFGSAQHDKQVLRPYIQSRYYRAPEIILGYPYSTTIDIWSFGCILLEILCGCPVFKGENEEQQLLSIMEYKGYPPSHMIDKSSRKHDFFHCYGRLNSQIESNTGVRPPGSRSLQDLLKCDSGLCELISHCLEWDPARRISSVQALNHPLFSALHPSVPVSISVSKSGYSREKRSNHINR